MKTILGKGYPFNIQHLAFIIPLLFFTAKGNAQSTINKVLASIAQNNKTIHASRQYWEAKKVEYKTGLTPYNPTLVYDYLFSTSTGIGNQTEIMVTQSFDFPSVYIKKKQLSNEKIAQTEFQQLFKRQDILLSAKKVCIKLIYLNKFHLQLKKRKEKLAIH